MCRFSEATLLQRCKAIWRGLDSGVLWLVIVELPTKKSTLAPVISERDLGIS